ncbi:MAG: 1-acyl-sn-glycerol-3-phosphate acyltransferase [Nanoarchaeota archaeon]
MNMSVSNKIIGEWKRIIDRVVGDKFSFGFRDKSGLEEVMEQEQGIVFMTNHQNIVFDGALTGYSVFDRYGLGSIPVFVIGDNLYEHPDAKRVLNSAGAIVFGRTGIEIARSYKRIRETLDSGRNIWIAQSPGRAKNGISKTDPSIIKGLTNRMKSSRVIVPTRVSYEFEPTVGLMAAQSLLEERAKSGGSERIKIQGEDTYHMKRGFFGNKGEVRLHFGIPISTSDYDNEVGVANEVSGQIGEMRDCFPINSWAMGRLGGDFDKHVDSQIFLARNYYGLGPEFSSSLRDRIVDFYRNVALDKSPMENTEN